MSAEKPLTPIAICETCYLEEHTNWEPESVNEYGNILVRLKNVEVPEKVNTGNVEICFSCGNLTVAGIYELKDLSSIHYIDQSDEADIARIIKNIEED